MGGSAVAGIVTIATAIVGLAILATLVSKNANSSGVISAATGGFAQDISAAVAPVTGGAGLSLPSIQTGISPA